MLYCSCSFLLTSSNIFFLILTHSLCLNFTYFRIFYTLIFRFGKVCVQSIPSGFGTFWFVLDAPDAFILSLSQSLWDFRMLVVWIYLLLHPHLILFCGAFLYASAVLWLIRIPLGYSPHTSISALNIRSSLFLLGVA